MVLLHYSESIGSDYTYLRGKFDSRTYVDKCSPKPAQGYFMRNTSVNDLPELHDCFVRSIHYHVWNDFRSEEFPTPKNSV